MAITRNFITSLSKIHQTPCRNFIKTLSTFYLRGEGFTVEILKNAFEIMFGPKGAPGGPTFWPGLETPDP